MRGGSGLRDCRGYKTRCGVHFCVPRGLNPIDAGKVQRPFIYARCMATNSMSMALMPMKQSPGLAAVGSVMRPRRIWRTGGVKSAVKRAPGRRPDHILRIGGRHGDLSANGRGQLFGAARPELLGGY